MKIGIVTLYDAFNYGSFLQAFALLNFFRDNDHDVRILDCSRDPFHTLKRIFKWTSLSSSMNNARDFFAFRKAWKLLPLEKSEFQYFDAIVVGSDEVWNVKNKYFAHYCEYFCENLNAKTKIAYAPSAGYTKINDLKNDEINGIRNFDFVFPRDDDTCTLAEYVRQEKLCKVLDPTLLQYEKWDGYAETVSADSKYIVYYSYFSTPFLVREICEFAKSNKLKIITPLFRRDWCDETLYLTPFHFLGLIRDASYVVTNTFHGTIYSILFKKRFINFSTRHKTNDFTNEVGLGSSRLYTEEMGHSRFSDILASDIDYEFVFKTLHRESNDCVTGLIERRGKIVLTNSVLYKGKENEKIFGF